MGRKQFNLEEAKAGKPVVDGLGNKARYLTTVRSDDYPLVFVIEEGHDEVVRQFSLAGEFYHGRPGDRRDLHMAPVKREGWVNIYPDECIHPTKASARGVYKADERVIATVRIEWEE